MEFASPITVVFSPTTIAFRRQHRPPYRGGFFFDIAFSMRKIWNLFSFLIPSVHFDRILPARPVTKSIPTARCADLALRRTSMKPYQAHVYETLLL